MKIGDMLILTQDKAELSISTGHASVWVRGFAVLQEEHHTPFRLNTCCVPGLCQRICPVSPTGP